MCTKAPQSYHSLPIKVLEDDLMFTILEFSSLAGITYSWFPFHVLMLFFLFVTKESLLLFSWLILLLMSELSLIFLSWCCGRATKKTRKQRNAIHINQLTNLLKVKITLPVKYWYCSLSGCLDWKTIFHTALPLTTRVSQIFLYWKTVSLTVLASPLFWFR